MTSKTESENADSAQHNLSFLVPLLFLWLLCFGACKNETSLVQPATDSETYSSADESDDLTFFERVTNQTGLTFRHHVGDPKDYLLPDIMVAGCGVIDFNRDGLLDLVLIDSGKLFAAQQTGEKSGNRLAAGSNRIYQQVRKGEFKDVTETLGLRSNGYGCGVAVADINNDGFDDLYFSNYGDDQLFLNESGKSFRDITKSSGLHNPAWGASATFLDFDRDGKLDLFVTNYVSYLPETRCRSVGDPEDFCSPMNFVGTVDKLFRNESTDDQVRFQNVTKDCGISSRKGPGLGVIARDFNQDGFPDLYVANDGKANFLWLNQNGERFDERGGQYGCAMSLKGKAQAGMGIAEADLDLNGVSDLVVTHMDGETNASYMGHLVQTETAKQLYFSESSRKQGVGQISKAMTGFGVGLPDLDNDGDQDMLTANGRVHRHQREPGERFWDDYAERNQISLNQGEGIFKECATSDPFCSSPEVSRGLAILDFDNDGRLDCLVVNTAGRADLFRNVYRQPGNWVGFQVVNPDFGGRSELGAVVTVSVADSKFRRTVQSDGSYLSASDARVHFGLGIEESIKKVGVRWLDQKVEQFTINDINRYHVLKKGSGQPAE